jgi:hypothetical protein
MLRSPRSSLARARLLPLRVGAAALLLALAGCLKVPTDGVDEPGAQQGAPKTASEVMDRYVTAIGGEPTLRELHQRTVEARITFLPETGCTDADEDCRREEKIGSFTLQTTDDLKLNRRTVIDNRIDEQGFDGKQGWALRDGAIVLADETETTLSREDANLHWYLDLEKRGVQLTLEPPRAADYDKQLRTLDGVRWKVKGTPALDKTLWFDRSTGLLQEEMLEDTNGDEVLRQWVLYDDYRPVDGVKVAHKIRLINQAGERTQEVVFINQRVHHEPVAADVFALPNIPAPKKAGDPLLDALARAQEAATAAPKDKDAVLNHARLAWAAAHFDDAAAAAEATLKLDPKEAEALWILARQRILAARFKEADDLLNRAEKAHVKPELIAAQRAWIRSHQRDFPGVARALDALGQENAALAGRYRTFVGKPMQVSVTGNGCVAELPVFKDSGPPMIEVEIGGEKVRAILDTGAADVIVDTRLATKLKLPIRSRSPIGQTAEIGHTQIDSLKLGDITVSAVPVDVFPSETLAQMSGSAQAASSVVVGVRVLEQFQVTYDLAADKLVLVHGAPKCKAALAARRSGGATPMWLHETHFVYVLGQMNGAEGLYLINTGMQGVDMTANKPAFARAGIGAPTRRADDPAIAQVDEFTLGSLLKATKLSAAYGYFEQAESSDQFRIDGMIGLEPLIRRRVTFDFPERKLYFGATDVPVKAK